MRTFLFILSVIVMAPCIAQQGATQVICSKHLSSYKTLSYEVASKEEVYDNLYSANVFITIRNLSSSFYLSDTLYMYSLAVANHENLVKARFFIHYEPYILADTLNIKEFELDKIRDELNEENWDIIYTSLFGVLIIDQYDINWRQQLHSGNIIPGGIKQMAPKKEGVVRRIYLLGEE